MGAINNHYRGNTVDLLDSLLALLLDHNGRLLLVHSPALDGTSFVLCRDCDKKILSGSTQLVENVFLEFLQH